MHTFSDVEPELSGRKYLFHDLTGNITVWQVHSNFRGDGIIASIVVFFGIPFPFIGTQASAINLLAKA